MKEMFDAQSLRVYVGAQDMWHGRPLYAALVERLKETGISGVTVLHGVEGFGAHGRLHTERLEVLFGNLPMVVEAIDTPERIGAALAVVSDMVGEGLATVQDVRAVRFRRDAPP